MALYRHHPRHRKALPGQFQQEILSVTVKAGITILFARLLLSALRECTVFIVMQYTLHAGVLQHLPYSAFLWVLRLFTF